MAAAFVKSEEGELIWRLMRDVSSAFTPLSSALHYYSGERKYKVPIRGKKTSPVILDMPGALLSYHCTFYFVIPPLPKREQTHSK